MKAKKKDHRDTFSERLDEAVRQRFPTVDCETSWNIFSMRLHSRWWVRGTDYVECKPHLALQVRAFVQGFSACEETWR